MATQHWSGRFDRCWPHTCCGWEVNPHDHGRRGHPFLIHGSADRYQCFMFRMSGIGSGSAPTWVWAVPGVYVLSIPKGRT